MLTLNRPGSLNALTTELMRSLLDGIQEAAADPLCRVISITGSGRAFCAGADLTAPGVGSDGDLALLNSLALTICAAPKPVVALVNGPAAGVGTSLVLASDIVLGSRSSYLKLGFDALGIIPDGGGTAFLPANLGRSRALQYALLGDRISADEALACGLYARLWDDAQFADAAAAVVGRLAAGPLLGMAATKDAINRRTLGGLAEQLEFERRTQADLTATRDFAEGKAAFAERRPPRFSGS